MKRSRILFLIAFSFLVGFILIRMSSQGEYVADAKDLTNVSITTQKVSEYLSEIEAGVDISEVSVEYANDNFYLMALDAESKWVYAIDLKASRNELYIDKRKNINACECNELSLDAFNFVDGSIQGCVGYNHKLIGKLQ